MKLFSLVKLFTLSLVLAIAANFIATPAFAANPPVLSSISPNISANNQGVTETTYAATFTGTDLNGITAVKFYSFDSGSATVDPNVYTTNLTAVDATHFTAIIHVPGSTKHRLLDVTATTSSGGEGPYLYGGFIVGQFPYPASGAYTDAITISLEAFADSAGTTSLPNLVQEGQHIWYKVQLTQESATTFDYLGGQLVLKFPDGSFHEVAGYGDLINSINRDIPEISPSHIFTVMSQDYYTATSADLKNGSLDTYVYYGPYPVYNQKSGTIEGVGPSALGASIGVSNSISSDVPEFGFIPGVIALLSSGGTFIFLKRRSSK